MTGYFYILKMSPTCLLISLSHFTAHPLLSPSLSHSVCVLNHRFNKQRLRSKQITPSFWLYKMCVFSTSAVIITVHSNLHWLPVTVLCISHCTSSKLGKYLIHHDCLWNNTLQTTRKQTINMKVYWFLLNHLVLSHAEKCWCAFTPDSSDLESPNLKAFLNSPFLSICRNLTSMSLTSSTLPNKCTKGKIIPECENHDHLHTIITDIWPLCSQCLDGTGVHMASAENML